MWSIIIFIIYIGYGFVVKCQKISTGKEYAMKVQLKNGILDSYADCCHRSVQEKEAVASIHHPFIVSMDYAFQTRTLAIMVMDLSTGRLQVCSKDSF